MPENAYLKSLLASRENSASMLASLEPYQAGDGRVAARCTTLREQILALDAMIEAEEARERLAGGEA